ncbi:hypothetical protein B0J11DRAFT_69286 [Dendryphion nanum]|uniref:N-acetyltransferase domain-containing protein n=1 Tax=Dendryphion nanum TaxID=256645 RepID=A0A9P9IGF7_9PLEO|nr:hypothetical protein B0J11DRAFT_69286 [Dendryphion nanum]
MEPKEWHHTSPSGQTFLISTSRSLLTPDFINTVFATKDMYWATPFSVSTVNQMLDNSLTLGIYLLPTSTSSTTSPSPSDSPSSLTPPSSPQPIGLARLITDTVTYAYLTDVYIDPAYRGTGLGKRVVACSKELVEQMEGLRWMVLFTGSEEAEKLYKRELGMQVLGKTEKKDGKGGLTVMGVKREGLRGVDS